MESFSFKKWMLSLRLRDGGTRGGRDSETKGLRGFETERLRDRETLRLRDFEKVKGKIRVKEICEIIFSGILFRIA
jgi:hypothetical protein